MGAYPTIARPVIVTNAGPIANGREPPAGSDESAPMDVNPGAAAIERLQVMAEERPSLHIDSDWKRQAQEEKKRLAEQEAKAKSTAPAAAGPVGVISSPAAAAPAAQRGVGGRAARDDHEMPQANFESLVQSLATQVFFYLGELPTRNGEVGVNLDMARYNLDMLGILEDKTRGNLTPDEQQTLDLVIYEARMRFVSVASRYAELP